MFQGLQKGNEDFKAYDIVLKLLSTGSGRVKNDTEPLKRNGEMPTGLPLPEEMPTTQLKKAKPTGLTGSPGEEASTDGVQMTYGAALAVLSLIDSFYELGVDKKDTYQAS